MEKNLKTKNIYIGIYSLLLATFFVVTNSDSTSPLFSTRCLDSGIFQYMGYAILQGKIPYTDFFDHKGLFLYFFNALGLLINKSWGIMLLQILYMALVLGVWYKGLIMVKNQLVRLAIIPIALVCLYHCYSCGNITEDWSLLFISYPLMRYIRNTELNRSNFSNTDLISIGICTGIITMIRVNNVAPMLGVLIYCTYDAIRRKEFAYLLRAIGLIFAGWTLPIIICIFYMYLVGGIKGIQDMFYANLIFNLDYNKDHAAPPYDIEYVKFIYKTLLPIPFILIAGYRKKQYLPPILIGYIITLMTIGGVHHYHYLIVFLPLIVYSIGIVKGKYQVALFVCILLFNAKTFYNQFSIAHFSLNHENTTAKLERLIEKIPKEERMYVWSYNGTFLLKEYIGNDLIQCNRVFLPWQIDISDGLKSTEENKITKIRPRYIIYADYVEKWMNESVQYSGRIVDEDFIKKNYMVVSSVTFYEGIKVDCYKLKD